MITFNHRVRLLLTSHFRAMEHLLPLMLTQSALMVYPSSISVTSTSDSYSCYCMLIVLPALMTSSACCCSSLVVYNCVLGQLLHRFLHELACPLFCIETGGLKHAIQIVSILLITTVRENFHEKHAHT